MAGILVVDREEPAGRPQGLGQLAADIGDLRDRQEGRHGHQGQQRQHRAVEAAALGQPGAGDDDRQTAQAGHHLQESRLQRQVAEERQAQPVMPPATSLEPSTAPRTCYGLRYGFSALKRGSGASRASF